MKEKVDLNCFSGYFAKTLAQRREILNNFNIREGIVVTDAPEDEQATLNHLTTVLDGALSAETANKMIENQVGMLQLPIGICPYMYVNNRHYIVPMATEEPSVIAAVSSISKLAFEKGVSFDVGDGETPVNGGFVAHASDNIMTAQIQITFNPIETIACYTDRYQFVQNQAILARDALRSQVDELVVAANEFCQGMVKRGGGTRSIRIEVVEPKAYELSVERAMQSYLEEMGVAGPAPAPAATEDPSDVPYIVAYLSVDVCDAMGANLLNTIAEGVAPRIRDVAAIAAAQCDVSFPFSRSCSIPTLSACVYTVFHRHYILLLPTHTSFSLLGDDRTAHPLQPVSSTLGALRPARACCGHGLETGFR